MAHYAELNENNEVIYVIYMENDIITDENGNEVEQLGIDHLLTHHGLDKRWIRTSYTGSFRGKYASPGDVYRQDLDKFISTEAPFPSWIFDDSIGEWEAPIPKPQDSNEYFWNEETQSWDLVEPPTP